MESTETVETTSTSSPPNQHIRENQIRLVSRWGIHIAILIFTFGFITEWTFDFVFMNTLDCWLVVIFIGVQTIDAVLVYQFIYEKLMPISRKAFLNCFRTLAYCVAVYFLCVLIIGGNAISTTKRIKVTAELMRDLPTENPISAAIRGAINGHQGMFLNSNIDEVFVQSDSNTYSLDDLAKSHTKAVAIKSSLVSWLDRADAMLRAEGAKSKEERKEIAAKNVITDTNNALDLVATCASSVECRSASH